MNASTERNLDISIRHSHASRRTTMLKQTTSRIAIFAVGALLPVLVSAALPPKNAYLERSKIVATGKTIKAYRVPMTDYNGIVKYRDVTITLGVADGGKADPLTTTIKDVASPKVLTNDFTTGNYTGAGDCVLSSGTILGGGRAQYGMTCNTSTARIELTWYTGAIIGHPMQAELQAAGIDQIPNADYLAWGKVANITSTYWNNCNLDTGDLISASQLGAVISISDYKDDAVYDCGFSATQSTP